MTRETQTIQDDIAYMRALAHEGRHAPLLAGPMLVAAGLIFGTANLGQWAIQAGVLNVNPWAQLGLWIAAAVAFGALINARLRAVRTGGLSADDETVPA